MSDPAMWNKLTIEVYLDEPLNDEQRRVFTEAIHNAIAGCCSCRQRRWWRRGAHHCSISGPLSWWSHDPALVDDGPFPEPGDGVVTGRLAERLARDQDPL